MEERNDLPLPTRINQRLTESISPFEKTQTYREPKARSASLVSNKLNMSDIQFLEKEFLFRKINAKKFLTLRNQH